MKISNENKFDKVLEIPNTKFDPANKPVSIPVTSRK